MLFVLIALLVGPLHEINLHILRSHQKLIDIAPKDVPEPEKKEGDSSATPQIDILTQKDKIQILLAEYNTLRSELVACGNKIYNMLAVGSAILTSQIVNYGKPYFWIIISIGVLLIITFTLLNIRDTRLLATRVKILEAEINKRACEPLLVWESGNGLYKNA